MCKIGGYSYVYQEWPQFHFKLTQSKKKKNTVENMHTFSQWLFQGGKITSEFFSIIYMLFCIFQTE